MITGTEIRPLLPQTFAMQTYSFVPPNLGLGDSKKSTFRPDARFALSANSIKDYVFVDEHNRHKRLKGRALMLRKFS